MIVGAAKSGTSSLVRLLHAAPRVAGNPSDGEIGYFLRDDEFGRGAGEARAKYFDSDDPDVLRIGKSAGLMYSETALTRLAADSPDVRAVAVLREPIARAHSAWLWAQRAGYETEDFAAAVRRELDGRDLDLPRPELRAYVARGEYARYLDRAAELLGSPVHIVTFEEFTADPSGVAGRVLAPFGRHVGEVSQERAHANRSRAVRSQRAARLIRSKRLRAPLRKLLPPRGKAALARFAHRMNDRAPGQQRAEIDAATRALLAEHFAPWNARLDALLGRPTGWQ